MTRHLIVVMMLALGWQASLVAFAGTSPLMSGECRSSPASPLDNTQKSCCPNDLHTTACCLDLCLTAAALATSPASPAWYGRTVPPLPFHASSFSSRGDSPRIRPPIL